jgi:tetratricopeptide (TPR) repeat protein
MLAAGTAVFAADLNRGKELYQQGKYAEAASELQQVAQEKSDDAEARRYLGLALLQQDKASEAAPHLTKADELSPSGETKLALAKLHLAQKDLDKAEAAVKDASGDDLELVRGRIHLERRRFEEAAKDLETYLEKHPDDAYAHYYVGLAYNGMKRPDKVLTHFELFLKMKPDAPEARKVRAVLRAVH